MVSHSRADDSHLVRIAIVFLLGCGAAALLGCGAATPPSAPSTATIRLELVEGTSQTLQDGTVVDVKGVGYAHLPDDKNLSSCTLVLRRGNEHTELPLAREHGGADPESSAPALGWEFSLEVSDPYRRPARAVVDARKL